jgi:hypothetical protein
MMGLTLMFKEIHFIIEYITFKQIFEYNIWLVERMFYPWNDKNLFLHKILFSQSRGNSQLSLPSVCQKELLPND